MNGLKFLFRKRFSWVEFTGICLTSFLYTKFGVWWIPLLIVFVVVQRIGEALVEDVE